MWGFPEVSRPVVGTLVDEAQTTRRESCARSVNVLTSCLVAVCDGQALRRQIAAKIGKNEGVCLGAFWTGVVLMQVICIFGSLDLYPEKQDCVLISWATAAGLTLAGYDLLGLLCCCCYHLCQAKRKRDMNSTLGASTVGRGDFSAVRV